MQEPTSQELAFQAGHWRALAGLWRQRLLCDVQLRAASGELLPAHGIVLASGSGFFRALLCGAGRCMREGCAAAAAGAGAAAPAGGASTPEASNGSGSTAACQQPGQLVVDLPYSAQQLSALLDILYEHKLNVCGANVGALLDMAAYLEVQPLQEACCEFLRSALSPDTAVDVLLLAHHYNCTSLQAEGVHFLAQRLASLLLAPDARQGLLRLPEAVLHQLLASEALEVEQETELLCFLADWVCATPAERQQQLPTLLPLLQLSALPLEPLAQHQLNSCASSDAASLAQQLHQAARHCHGSMQQRHHAQPSPCNKQLAGQPSHSPNKQRKLMPAAGALGGGGGGSGSLEAASCSKVLSQLQFLAAEGSTPGASTSSSSGAAAGGDGSSSSSSATWWLSSTADADVNNHTSAPFSSLDGLDARCGMSTSSSSSAAAAPAAAAAADSAIAAAEPLWSLCEAGRLGAAVVTEAWPGRQRGHQPTSILVAGGHDPSWRGLRIVEVYDPAADAWSLGPTLPAALPFAGAGLPLKGQLYVIGGPMCSSYMARLDVANQAWCNCEGPRLSRLHAAVTGAAGLLYLTGGRTQVNQVVAAVEAYDPATAAWRPLPDMLHPRYAHALAPQGGCLYALGGQASKAIHRTVEVFDPQRGAWQALAARLTCERKYCAAASLGGRLVVLGGLNEARCRLSSVEAYDPREGRWSSLTAMQCPRSSCSAASLGGRLYVMGGSAGDDRLHCSVEAFDPAASRWRSCAALSCHRSGLTAAAI